MEFHLILSDLAYALTVLLTLAFAGAALVGSVTLAWREGRRATSEEG